MGYLRFLGACASWAWQPWKKAEPVTSGLSALLPPSLSWVPAILLFIFLLPIAPYKIWEREKRRADTIVSEIKPILEVVSVKEEAGYFVSDTGWGLIVRNNGTKKACG